MRRPTASHRRPPSRRPLLAVPIAGAAVLALALPAAAAGGWSGPADRSAGRYRVWTPGGAVGGVPVLEPPPGEGTGQGELFDDFRYTSGTDPLLAAHGWQVRSRSGGPGPAGAVWDPAGVTTSGTDGGDRVLVLTSATDGTAAGTRQAELSTSARRFRLGTYAARIRFTEAPVSGPDVGDHRVQAFFAMAPARYDGDPLFSELDVEYLPHGAWDLGPRTLIDVSWFSYREEPWSVDNAMHVTSPVAEGWHTVVVRAREDGVWYYLDGRELGSAPARFVPRQPMAIHVNQWFVGRELGSPGEERGYRQDVDWVYFAQEDLTADAVASRVAGHRAAAGGFVDTLPAS